MATTVTLPLWTFRLAIAGGHDRAGALLFPESASVDLPTADLASRFTEATHERWARRGMVLPWLDLGLESAFSPERLELEVPTSAAPGSPPLRALFDLAVHQDPGRGGAFGVMPALGLSAWGEDRAALRAAAVDAIRLEFAREKRLDDPLRVLETQIYDGLEVQKEDVKAVFHTFHEMAELDRQSETRWLGRVSEEVKVPLRRVFEVEDQVEAACRVLASAMPPNLLVVGEAGSGKSALLEELVRTRAQVLGDAPVRVTQATTLIRVLTQGDGWQANLVRVCQEARDERCWLWIRGLGDLFEVGRYEGNPVSVGEYLRPWLERGEIRVLTECTPGELSRIDARYPGILPLFAQVRLEPMPPERLVSLLGQRAAVDTGRPDAVAPDALRVLHRLFRRFAPYSGQPARSLRFLEGLLRFQDHVGPEDIFARFCAESGIPRALVDPSVPLPVPDLRRRFADQVHGQPPVVDAVVDLLLSVRASMSRQGRPIAALLLVGPTGVGKTETAKALARFLFGDASRLVRFDMSEYSHPAAALSLIEGPGGEGRLTGAVRREPFSVLLLDEIEKADPLVFDLLLQVLGEGRLTDGRGRLADFCSSVIVMTSNIGAGAADRPAAGFSGPDEDRSPGWMTAVRAFFRPELVNRMDLVLPFAPLGLDAITRVLDRERAALLRWPGLACRKVSLEILPEARDWLARRGVDPTWGARHLQRTLRTELVAPLARSLNANPTSRPLDVEVGLEGDRIRITATESRSLRSRAGAQADELDRADAISALRRQVEEVSRGWRSMEVRSELQRLERLERRHEPAAWERRPEAPRLRQLQERLDALMALAEDALALELEVLERMLAPDPPADGGPAGRLDALHSSARAVFRGLYEVVHAEEELCLVGIYGPVALADAQLAIYRDVASDLGWGFTPLACWVDENEEFTVPVAPARPPARGTRVGWEVTVPAVGAHALFSSEGGVHLWPSDGSRRNGLFVASAPVAREDWPEHRPAQCHRASILKGEVRRRVKDKVVVDPRLDREWPRADLPAMLRASLTEAFHALILADLSG